MRVLCHAPLAECCMNEPPPPPKKKVYIEAERLKKDMDALPTPPASVLNALNPSESHRAWHATVAAHRSASSSPLSPHAYTGSNFSHTTSVREHASSLQTKSTSSPKAGDDSLI
jgi:hypothetical protein